MANNNERTYQEDEYVDVGEEVARSWSEIERWRQANKPADASTTRDIADASSCPPNTIGRTHPTVGEITRGDKGKTIGGE